MKQLAIERLKQAMYELRAEGVPGGMVRTDDLRALIDLAAQLAPRVKDLEAGFAAGPRDPAGQLPNDVACAAPRRWVRVRA